MLLLLFLLLLLLLLYEHFFMVCKIKYSIYRGIRIYTGTFRTSPVEALYVEANDPPMELRSKELGLRFLVKIVM